MVDLQPVSPGKNHPVLDVARRITWTLLAGSSAAAALVLTYYVLIAGGDDPLPGTAEAESVAFGAIVALLVVGALLVGALRRTWVRRGSWHAVAAALVIGVVFTSAVIADVHAMEVQTNSTWTTASVLRIIATAVCWWAVYTCAGHGGSRFPWAFPLWAVSWTLLMVALGVQNYEEFNALGYSRPGVSGLWAWTEEVLYGIAVLMLACTAAVATSRAVPRRSPVRVQGTELKVAR